jgi:hypothetical protein
VYFSVTCREDRLLGLQDYTQLEGMGLKIIPIHTPSNRSFYIYGSGRVAADKVYDRVMNKWRWGNFDKRDMYVDHSYGASLQAQKMIIWRTSETLLDQGEKEKAVALTDKYFEAFPDFNFPYDPRTMPHINIYIQAGEYEKARKHMRILANNVVDYMEFFNSLSQEDIEAGFDLDYRLTRSSIQEIGRVSKQLDDPAFAEEIQNLLEPYLVNQTRNE